MKGLFPLLLDSSFIPPLPFLPLLAHCACLCGYMGHWGGGGWLQCTWDPHTAFAPGIIILLVSCPIAGGRDSG